MIKWLTSAIDRLFAPSWSRSGGRMFNNGGWLPLVLAAASAAKGLYDQKKAKGLAKDAAAASQVDINALDAKTREIARKNALESAALERELTPEVPELRSAATRGVTANLGDSPETKAGIAALMGGLGKSVGGTAMSPLLQAAIAKAKANLELGGQLDIDTKNSVMRAGLARAGAVGGGGLGLGRDIVARDLGLTSLDLERQRLAEATQLGGMELGGEQFNVNSRFADANNLLNQVSLLSQISNQRFGRNIAGAQLGQSIQGPTVGLDPGSVADAMTGNATNRAAALSNQANIYGQQSSNYMNLAGGLAGMYGTMSRPSTPASAASSGVSPYLARTGSPYATSLPRYGGR